MEKDDTKREYIQLYRVLEEMQEHLGEYREKYDKKRWKPFDEQNLSLQACLGRLTKDELSKIRTHLNIHGASALKKQALIELIAEQLPQQIIRLLKMFDLERFRILEQVCAQGDRGCYPENVDNFDYFVSRGLFFTGTLDNQKVQKKSAEPLSLQIMFCCKRNCEEIRIGFPYPKVCCITMVF